MPVDLTAFFDRFDLNISLGPPQTNRIESAAENIMAFVRGKYGLPTGSVFLQGSYPNHTAVEPVEGGEYDVDVVAVCVDSATAADAALDALEGVFKGDGRFASRVKTKKCCVRLEYAEDDVGSFHVDIVPVRQIAVHPFFEAPRRSEGWHGTAPLEYTQWCTSQGAYYASTVRALKRWRDEQQSVRTAVKSIVLQVLASQYMPVVSDPSVRLIETLKAMHRALSSLKTAPRIPNPALASENLAARWSDQNFRSFVTELAEAVEVAKRVEAAQDVVDAADAWRGLLGSDFPLVNPVSLGITVSDFSHAQTPAQRGWAEQFDSRYAIEITAKDQLRRSGRHAPLESDKGIVFQGHQLLFKAHVRAPNHASVWWQVANTGGHARSASGLRGEIFKGRDLKGRPTPDETDNWEATSYTGAHLIRALLVRDSMVVARSEWFIVHIFARGHPFVA
jgi:hypothetical protein